jgi:hypothetical protein
MWSPPLEAAAAVAAVAASADESDLRLHLALSHERALRTEQQTQRR